MPVEIYLARFDQVTPGRVVSFTQERSLERLVQCFWTLVTDQDLQIFVTETANKRVSSDYLGLVIGRWRAWIMWHSIIIQVRIGQCVAEAPGQRRSCKVFGSICVMCLCRRFAR